MGRTIFTSRTHSSCTSSLHSASALVAEYADPNKLPQLMGTIQERLYPNKEITRSMLRTGHWESFIRSLDHELQMMTFKAKNMLRKLD